MKLISYSFLLLIMLMMQRCQLTATEPAFKYLVREPLTKTAVPRLVLLMHGWGSNEKDLFSFAGQLPPDCLVVAIRAPIEVAKDGYAWYDLDFSTGKILVKHPEQIKTRIQEVLQFITELRKTHQYDTTQVYLCGFSQGAMMAYSIGLTHPDRIRGIAVLSGRIPDEVKTLIVPGDKLKSLNVFVTHGTQDNKIGISQARESIEYIKQLGLHPSYKEYNEGHAINNDMFSDLLAWFNKK